MIEPEHAGWCPGSKFSSSQGDIAQVEDGGSAGRADAPTDNPNPEAEGPAIRAKSWDRDEKHGAQVPPEEDSLSNLTDQELYSHAMDQGIQAAASMSRPELLVQIRLKSEASRESDRLGFVAHQKAAKRRGFHGKAPAKRAGEAWFGKLFGGGVLAAAAIWEMSTLYITDTYLVPYQQTNALRNFFSSGALPVLVGLYGVSKMFGGLSDLVAYMGSSARKDPEGR